MPCFPSCNGLRRGDEEQEKFRLDLIFFIDETKLFEHKSWTTFFLQFYERYKNLEKFATKSGHCKLREKVVTVLTAISGSPKAVLLHDDFVFVLKEWLSFLNHYENKPQENYARQERGVMIPAQRPAQPLAGLQFVSNLLDPPKNPRQVPMPPYTYGRRNGGINNPVVHNIAQFPPAVPNANAYYGYHSVIGGHGNVWHEGEVLMVPRAYTPMPIPRNGSWVPFVPQQHPTPPLPDIGHHNRHTMGQYGYVPPSWVQRFDWFGGDDDNDGQRAESPEDRSFVAWAIQPGAKQPHRVYGVWWKGVGLEECLRRNIRVDRDHPMWMNRPFRLSEFIPGAYLERGGLLEQGDKRKQEFCTALLGSFGYFVELKTLKKTDHRLHDLENEIWMQRSMSTHPNILRAFGSIEIVKSFIMVLEYAPHGDLKSELQKCAPHGFPHADIATYILSAVEALMHCHRNGVIHCDLKPENMMIFEKKLIKLSGFGMCVHTRPRDKPPHFDTCGTISYMSPEMIMFRGYDEKVDNWAVGVVLYEFLFNLLPFCGEHVDEIKNNIVKSTPNWPADNWKTLLLGLLCKDPKHRMSLDMVKNSEWLVSLSSQNRM